MFINICTKSKEGGGPGGEYRNTNFFLFPQRLFNGTGKSQREKYKENAENKKGPDVDKFHVTVLRRSFVCVKDFLSGISLSLSLSNDSLSLSLSITFLSFRDWPSRSKSPSFFPIDDDLSSSKWYYHSTYCFLLCIYLIFFFFFFFLLLLPFFCFCFLECPSVTLNFHYSQFLDVGLR